MLYEIHMLKNYAPTNLNRDDTGSPKTCLFGGVQRGRISSQCLKHSWRISNLLKESIGNEYLGIRTRTMPTLIGEQLRKAGISEEFIEIVVKKLTGFGNKEGKSSDENDITAQVILYSHSDLEVIEKLIINQLNECHNASDVKKIDVKNLQAELSKLNKDRKNGISLDMALFGRMVTSDAFEDVDAAMQVAHAIGTNRLMMESDYFTAVDDVISEKKDQGSAMIGDVDYNSSCYYIYASLDTDKLSENLKNNENVGMLIKNAIPALIKTMAYTSPSGKQNSFAGHSLPSAILVECKEKKVPISYANAFEIPVRPTASSGIVRGSVEKLMAEVQKIQKGFELPIVKRLWFTMENVETFEEKFAVNCASFPELIEQLPID
ncbi:MAG TPA: type I-E CRISPR-associated protein Cas7/Cse4/CasC [Acholeplasmatales bacterium]|nr:type I-E CRISPR-associated protein Cas7/Cse4/CasC [Acholeplasmatales bacterium]